MIQETIQKIRNYWILLYFKYEILFYVSKTTQTEQLTLVKLSDFVLVICQFLYGNFTFLLAPHFNYRNTERACHMKVATPRSNSLNYYFQFSSFDNG